ncbi:MAG: DEAD/DEAH box helicase [Tannerellaceae bacterium]
MNLDNQALASFSPVTLIKPLVKALAREQYETFTPIQQEAIPAILKGDDVLAIAQTGTGKTAAFLLPVLQLLTKEKLTKEKKASPGNQALILVPTRELGIQTGEYTYRYGRYLPLSHVVIYGGVPHQPQVEMLKGEIDLIIATPGRLLELVHRGALRLERIKIIVLDEADRMLDMGFLPDIRTILSRLPSKRQSLLFTATLSPLTSLLADSLLHNPTTLSITPAASVGDQINQCVWEVERTRKEEVLLKLLRDPATESAIIFLNSRKGADRLYQRLKKLGLSVGILHADLKQTARLRIVDELRERKIRFLVATDLAARGLDIEELSHVINYEMPQKPENYVHRIGRTGRAGNHGTAISLCDKAERKILAQIERLTGEKIPSCQHYVK